MTLGSSSGDGVRNGLNEVTSSNSVSTFPCGRWDHAPLLFLCSKLKARSPRDIDDWLDEADVIGFVGHLRGHFSILNLSIAMQFGLEVR